MFDDLQFFAKLKTQFEISESIGKVYPVGNFKN